MMAQKEMAALVNIMKCCLFLVCVNLLPSTQCYKVTPNHRQMASMWNLPLKATVDEAFPLRQQRQQDLTKLVLKEHIWVLRHQILATNADRNAAMPALRNEQIFDVHGKIEAIKRLSSTVYRKRGKF